MKKLLATTVLGLGLTGFVLADDGNVPAFGSTVGKPYDGATLGRAGHPEPTPSIDIEAFASGLKSLRMELDANG